MRKHMGEEVNEFFRNTALQNENQRQLDTVLEQNLKMLLVLEKLSPTFEKT